MNQRYLLVNVPTNSMMISEPRSKKFDRVSVRIEFAGSKDRTGLAKLFDHCEEDTEGAKQRAFWPHRRPYNPPCEVVRVKGLSKE